MCVLGIIPQLGRNRFESLSLSDSENLTEQRQRRHLIELDDYNDDDDVTTLYQIWLLLFGVNQMLALVQVLI